MANRDARAGVTLCDACRAYLASSLSALAAGLRHGQENRAQRHGSERYVPGFAENAADLLIGPLGIEAAFNETDDRSRRAQLRHVSEAAFGNAGGVSKVSSTSRKWSTNDVNSSEKQS